MTAVEIRTLTTGEWAILRDTRFASLRDAPEAFTSTVEHEEGYPPEVWQLRTGTSAVAFAAGQPVGIAGWHRPEPPARPSSSGCGSTPTTVAPTSRWRSWST